MSTTTSNNGRLCNQIIRNLCVSFIAQKHNLFVIYSSYDKIRKLGINLFIGQNKYNNSIELNDNNFFDILNSSSIMYNLEPNKSYFQTKEISNYLYNYLTNDENKINIINANPYKDRYNNNNDCFIHIRLTDAEQYNPGVEFYLQALNNINFNTLSNTLSNTLFIASDDINHKIIKTLQSKYPELIIINYNDVETIQFGSTCKNLILSHGSYSVMIGYLAFYSNIFYKKIDEFKKWHGDIFSIPNWHCIV